MTECPVCGAGNAMRASNEPSKAFCNTCGWVDLDTEAKVDG